MHTGICCGAGVVGYRRHPRRNARGTGVTRAHMQALSGATASRSWGDAYARVMSVSCVCARRPVRSSGGQPVIVPSLRRCVYTHSSRVPRFHRAVLAIGGQRNGCGTPHIGQAAYRGALFRGLSAFNPPSRSTGLQSLRTLQAPVGTILGAFSSLAARSRQPARTAGAPAAL